MKRLISVAIILLFIGLAFATSINANTQSDFVEFTTELCGYSGDKQTVRLNQQQADEVEELFDSIREQLNTTESRDEAEEIFKDAVVELDKYNLLGGLSIKQAQRLVTDGKKITFLLDSLDMSINNNKINDSNLLCLTAGYNRDSMFLSILGLFYRLLLILLNPPFQILVLALIPVYIRQWIPWCFLNSFFLNKDSVLTFGINGKKTLGDSDSITVGYGFTGIKIFINDYAHYFHFYLGFSLFVIEFE